MIYGSSLIEPLLSSLNPWPKTQNGAPLHLVKYAMMISEDGAESGKRGAKKWAARCKQPFPKGLYRFYEGALKVY